MEGPTASTSRGPALYHLHIPKTAGTSLHALLAARFPPEAVCPVRSIVDLLRMPADRFRRFDFFSGHLQFGFDLPEMIGRLVRVVTLLRDPIATLLSRYKQVAKEPKDPARPYFDAYCPTLERFVADPLMAAYVANSQARYLGEEERFQDAEARRQLAAAEPGQARRILFEAAIRHHSPDADELLRRARARLAECAVVGIVERMRESIERMSEVFYGPPLELPPWRNRSPDTRTAADLDAATRRRIERLTELDRQLYDEVARSFRRPVEEPRALGPPLAPLDPASRAA